MITDTQRALRDYILVSQNAPEDRQPSLTLDENNIFREIDGLEALQQLMRRMLMTERFENTIYDHSYGMEFQELVGQDMDLVQADISRRIQEALLEDDRIRQVYEFSTTIDKTILNVTFTVVTIFGTTEMAVNYEI